MERRDNYRLQLQQAQQSFLSYDQQAIIRKLKLRYDESYFYPVLLGSQYRLCRSTGSLSRLAGDQWVDANTHSEVMTLLDLICDSREDRCISHRWKDMVSFGQYFHRELQMKDPWAVRFDADPNGLARACEALGGEPFPQGDVAYAIEVFDGLRVVVQLWLADEEFPPTLRFLWDENALQYLKYETMYFARNLLLCRLEEQL